MGGRDAMALVGPGLAVGIPACLLWRRTRRSAADRPGERSTARSSRPGSRSPSPRRSRTCCPASLDRFDLALFESVSGFTTTASTVIADLEDASRGHPAVARDRRSGSAAWRSSSFVVSVLPYFRTAGFEHLAGISRWLGWRADRLARPGDGEALVLLYVGVHRVRSPRSTRCSAWASFDASRTLHDGVDRRVLHARSLARALPLSRASSGRRSSAMILAGGNFALYWQALRGKPSIAAGARSRCARTSFIVALVGVAALFWNAPRVGWSHDGVRRTLFGAVSISTTTGYTRRRLRPVGRCRAAPAAVRDGRSAAWPADRPAASRSSAWSPSSDTSGGTSSGSCTRGPCPIVRIGDEVIAEAVDHADPRLLRPVHGRRRDRDVPRRRRSADLDLPLVDLCGRDVARQRRSGARRARSDAPLPRRARRRARRADGRDARRTTRALSRPARHRPAVPVHRRPAAARASRRRWSRDRRRG